MKFDLSAITLSKADIRRRIRLPSSLNADLAELIGIIIGDGHLEFRNRIDKKGRSFTSSAIIISGNLKEKSYMCFVMDLFKRVFNCHSKLTKENGRNALRICIYSLTMVQYLNKICQIPVGKKSHNVSIPSIIKTASHKEKCSFLRGLADTDFSLTFKNKSKAGHSYPVIRAAFKSKFLVQDLENLYTYLNFKFCTVYNEKGFDKRIDNFYTIHCIYLNGMVNFLAWHKDIGFSNFKFQRKVGKFLQEGVCPPGY